MDLLAQIALAAVLAFLIGAVNPATLLARARGRDLLTSGSGNPGATNAGRVLGRGWGALVLVLDVLKAYLPTVLVLRSAGLFVGLVVGVAVVVGHVWSPFLRGHGGKGVACAFGSILAVEPRVGAAALVVFVLALVVLRFIGVASVVAAGVVAVVGLLALGGLVPPVGPEVGAWLVLVAGLVLSRHRRNVLAWWSRGRG